MTEPTAPNRPAAATRGGESDGIPIEDVGLLDRNGPGPLAVGVSPRDTIDILKSIKASGALHAEFIVR